MTPVDGERVRHCGECKLNVYNLSEMTQTEAEGLIRKHEGRLCVRYYQRADGTVLTRNCPVGEVLQRPMMGRYRVPTEAEAQAAEKIESSKRDAD